MIVLLLCALAVMAFLCYTFCYSPLAKRIGDALFWDDMFYESYRRRGEE